MLYHRGYSDYDAYVRHQGCKAVYKKSELLSACPRRIAGFEGLFKIFAPLLNPGSVLCLGARTGCEVMAFRNLGFTGSMGIDLHPIGNEDVVIKGDWHALTFGDGSFDNIYTNSIDHCLYLPKMISESKRVLVPGGILFLMAGERPDENVGKRVGKNNEALLWDYAEDLLPEFEAGGFRLFEKWQGGKWRIFLMKSATMQEVI